MKLLKYRKFCDIKMCNTLSGLHIISHLEHYEE